MIKKYIEGKVTIWPKIFVLIIGLVVITSYVLINRPPGGRPSIKIEVLSTGTYINRNEVDLRNYLTNNQLDQRMPVVIMAAYDAETENVARAIDIVRELGFSDVALSTIEP